MNDKITYAITILGLLAFSLLWIQVIQPTNLCHKITDSYEQYNECYDRYLQFELAPGLILLFIIFYPSIWALENVGKLLKLVRGEK